MKILCFARARELLGADHLEVDLPEPATIGNLRRQLMHAYPNLAGLLKKSAFAINDEYAEDATRIPAEAEVALLPPVSGG